MPSPNSANCRSLVPPPPPPELAYFQAHIAGPDILAKTSVDVLATNFLLACVLALAMGFFGTLLNDALESNEEYLQQLFGPLRLAVEPIRRLTRWLGAAPARGASAWVRAAAGWVVLCLVYGLILSFLDPGFDAREPAGWLSVCALAVSTGLISLADDIAQYLYLRGRGARGIVQLHSGNTVLLVLTTLLSRFSGLQPGLLLGSPAGIEEVDAPEFEVKGHLLGISATALVAVIAWGLASLFGPAAWFKTLFLLIFAVGVQTLFFELLPLKYLHGRGVFQFNRVLWLALFVVAAVVFLQTVLNPDGAFISAFESPNMIALAAVVIAFCLFSTAAWFYFQYLEKKQARDSNAAQGVRF